MSEHVNVSLLDLNFETTKLYKNRFACICCESNLSPVFFVLYFNTCPPIKLTGKLTRGSVCNNLFS